MLINTAHWHFMQEVRIWRPCIIQYELDWVYSRKDAFSEGVCKSTSTIACCSLTVFSSVSSLCIKGWFPVKLQFTMAFLQPVLWLITYNFCTKGIFGQPLVLVLNQHYDNVTGCKILSYKNDKSFKITQSPQIRYFNIYKQHGSQNTDKWYHVLVYQLNWHHEVEKQ